MEEGEEGEEKEVKGMRRGKRRRRGGVLGIRVLVSIFERVIRSPFFAETDPIRFVLGP